MIFTSLWRFISFSLNVFSGEHPVTRYHTCIHSSCFFFCFVFFRKQTLMSISFSFNSLQEPVSEKIRLQNYYLPIAIHVSTTYPNSAAFQQMYLGAFNIFKLLTISIRKTLYFQYRNYCCFGCKSVDVSFLFFVKVLCKKLSDHYQGAQLLP